MMIFKLQTQAKTKQSDNRTLTFLVSILALCMMITSYSAKAEDRALDGIAAVVNNELIMVSEVNAAAKELQKSTELTGNRLFQEVLEKLIMDRLQVQRAKEVGIKIDDAAVDTAMQSIAKQNNIDLQQLRVAIIERGINFKEFRESIRDRLYSDTLRRRQLRRNNIGESEVDDLIQAESFKLSQNIQYQLIDIVVPNNNTSVQQFNVNLNKARNVRNKLLLNKNLSSTEIAKLGATMKELGWKNSETLSPAFSRTLSLMGEGEMSDVIRDAEGFHILKLVKQRGGKRQQIQEAKVRHILISNDDPKAKLKVTQFRNKILAGESFSQLATKFSADKGSAANGGELPMSNTANYVPPFAEAANTLALNTLSQPIKTRFGWHIMEVLERRKSDKTRESIKNKATQLLGTKNREEETKNWLKALRDDAYVEYRFKP